MRKPLSSNERKNILKKYPYYGASGIIDYVDNYIFQNAKLLISEDGANLLNRTKDIAFIANGKYWVNNHAHIMDSINLNILMYIKFYINAVSIADYVTGSAQPKLTQRNLFLINISIPPLSEQQRIVSKIEELFTELDKIDKAQETYDNAANKLREKVLDTAMHGKLVPQDPNDEPASELLKRIEDEKQRLIKEKVIKKQKALPPIEKDEEPFEIPESWKWVRLGNVGIWGAGSTPNRKRSEFYEEGNIPWVKTGDLNNGFINRNNVEESVTQLALNEYSFTKINKNNILIAMYGATIGKLAISKEERYMVSNQACCVGKLILQEMDMLYLFYSLKAFYNDLVQQGAGGAQPNISRQKIINFFIPLPPLFEQQRIVSKIEEILPLLEV